MSHNLAWWAWAGILFAAAIGSVFLVHGLLVMIGY